MDDVWIRLYNGRWPIPGGSPEFGWSLWQAEYTAAPWPRDELQNGFVFYICETLADGTRALTNRATATRVLPPTPVTNRQQAYDLVAEHVFDDALRIAPQDWHVYHYNALKADLPWPQQIVAWRAKLVALEAPVLIGAQRFERTGWLKTSAILLPQERDCEHV